MIDEFKDNNDELIKELLDEYKENSADVYQIQNLLNQLNNCSDKSKLTQIVEDLQEITNKLYEVKNTEMLIELQVIINRYRNEFDITDPREIIHVDNGRGYVQ